ncbi:lipase [Nocardia sp. NPDC005366]|uniref:esterase/lipase family protein n=1 Tax=Nocardia sp. NPDC005366 TaxID=3156878 RepID=UPI00339F7115
MTSRSRIIARTAGAASLALGILAATVPAASAQPSAPGACSATTVLVHDIGRDQSEFGSMAAALHDSGYCTTSFTYGVSAATDILGSGGTRVAGLATMESSAAELAQVLSTLDAAGATPVAIVAHGSGSLVAQYFLQHFGAPPALRDFVTIGPIWNGTNIAALGAIEQLSRDLGTYDAVLALETPLVDPQCAGCRQLVTGSDFLTALHRDGIPTPGIDYTNIISRTDILVEPPMSADAAGMYVAVVQDAQPGNAVDHFRLLDDPAVARLTIAALGHQREPFTYHRDVSPIDAQPHR